MRRAWIIAGGAGLLVLGALYVSRDTYTAAAAIRPRSPADSFRSSANRLRAINDNLDVQGGRGPTLAHDLARGIIPI